MSYLKSILFASLLLWVQFSFGQDIPSYTIDKADIKLSFHSVAEVEHIDIATEVGAVVETAPKATYTVLLSYEPDEVHTLPNGTKVKSNHLSVEVKGTPDEIITESEAGKEVLLTLLRSSIYKKR